MNADHFIKGTEIKKETIGEGISRKIYGYDDNLMLVLVEFDEGVSVEPHHHIHSQSSLISKGSFKVTIGDKTKELKEGDAFYVPPNVVHSVVSLEESEIIDAFSPAREDFFK